MGRPGISAGFYDDSFCRYRCSSAMPIQYHEPNHVCSLTLFFKICLTNMWLTIICFFG
jgi:hypothetical protein